MLTRSLRFAAPLAIILTLTACTAASTQGKRAPARPPANSGLLDLNTATAAQLQRLPGITEVYAKRIVANRPYKVKHELETRRILPPAVYRKIRNRVFANEPVTRDLERTVL